MQDQELDIIAAGPQQQGVRVLRHGRAVQQDAHGAPVQEIDIIGAMLATVRASLGAMFTPEAEKDIEAKLRVAWGGQAVYIRKQDVDAQARARDIRARYDMRNRRELMAEYGLSRGHFYKILAGG